VDLDAILDNKVKRSYDIVVTSTTNLKAQEHIAKRVICMAGTMVSSSTGAVNSLLGKFTTLMGDEYANKLKGVRKEVASLEDEFRSIKAFLEKLEDMDDNLDSEVKEWRNQVIEGIVIYDIEDCIDDFMRQLAKQSDASAGFVKKTASRLLKKLRMRHQIASRIQKIKTRVQEATERRMRYKLDEYCVPNPSYMPIDPRVVAIYAKAAGLVGIDSPRDELTKLLMVRDQELKVSSSIVGFGGLGKTTLASQVYHKLEGQYDCRAFVSVSQNPNLPKLLHQILLKITGQCFSHVDELGELLNNILCHLRDKR
jgi:disease resistance protein RPM1